MKVKEVMDKPVFISPDATKKEILQLAKANPYTRIFIIKDNKGNFMGDIHEDDIFYMVLPNDSYDDIGVELGFDLEKKFFAQTARELMRKYDLSCNEEEELIDAALKLAGAEINEMPVLDKNGQVVGVITQALLLRHMDYD